MRIHAALLFVGCVLASVQNAAPVDDVYRVGPGVKAPKRTRSVEPEYTQQARSAGIQGTVVFDLVVDERGKPRDITIVSPLGFGLDEAAQKAIERWEFEPGTKNGSPVKIAATAEVNYRLLGRWYDAKAERRRTAYNRAIRDVQRPDEKSRTRAVATIQDLAKQNFAPAMFAAAVFMDEGRLLPRDPDQSLKLLTKAADKNYGPALYEVGRRCLAGRGGPVDTEQGFKLIRDAAVLGSTEAQIYLGRRYETGDGVEQDPDRARRYYRLCAAAGNEGCQFRLAQSLLKRPGRQERDYVQAVAWLEMAAERGLVQARSVLEDERRNFTAAQAAQVAKLKTLLARKP